MSADFHFLRPVWLVALPALWLLLGWYLRSRARGGAWSRVCDAALLPFVTAQGTNRVNAKVGGLVGAGLTLAVLALAGPTWERLPVPVFRSESALVLALDLSTSMNAADLKPSRLERAKYKIADVLRLRKTGQTALVVFAAQAFTVTPLTDDGATISAQLPALDSRIMPSQGSAPASAIELGAKLLAQAGAPNGHIVLLTDGAESDALARARTLAADGDFRLSVLAVGTRDGAPVPDVAGGFFKTPQGDIVMSRVDMDALRTLAAAGRGLFTEISADDTDLNHLVGFLERDLDAHNQRMEQLAADQWYEVGPWLLLPLLPLAALAFRRGILLAVLAAGLGTLLPPDARADWWRTPDQAGQAAWRAQRYGDAAERFDDPAWRAAARYRNGDFAGAADALKDTRDARARYNLGNALARQGKLTDAIKAYDEALALAPEDDDARYNKALLEKLLEQDRQQNDQQKNQSDQKKQQRPNDSQESEQQFQGEKGGASEENSSDATNAGGGAQSRDKQADDRATEEGGGNGRGAEQKAGKDNQDAREADAAKQQARNESEAEKAQATEQWLRQVPDDPSGLLRRKFEYQYKQIYGEEPRDGHPW